jgi:hypothetical protein
MIKRRSTARSMIVESALTHSPRKPGTTSGAGRRNFSLWRYIFFYLRVHSFIFFV